MHCFSWSFLRADPRAEHGTGSAGCSNAKITISVHMGLRYTLPATSPAEAIPFTDDIVLVAFNKTPNISKFFDSSASPSPVVTAAAHFVADRLNSMKSLWPMDPRSGSLLPSFQFVAICPEIVGVMFELTLTR